MRPLYFSIHRNHAIHALKVAIACIIGYAIMLATNRPHGQWIIITILVVMCMQTSVGGALQSSYLRFIGTTIGAATAVVILYLYGAHPAAIFILLFFSTLIFTYIANVASKLSNIGLLGAVTTAMLITSKASGYQLAIERALEIYAGIIIAILVTRFLFPVHAKKQFIISISDTLNNLHLLYKSKLKSFMDESTGGSIDLINKISASFVDQKKLLEEGGRESKSFKFKGEILNDIIYCERQIFRTTLMIFSAAQYSKFIANHYRNLPQLEKFNSSITSTLQQLATINLRNSQEMPEIIELDDLKSAVTLLKGSLASEMHAHPFLFCAQELVSGIDKMQTLILQTKKK